MTGDVARMRELVRLLREVTRRIEREVDRIERDDLSSAEPVDRPALRIVR